VFFYGGLILFVEASKLRVRISDSLVLGPVFGIPSFKPTHRILVLDLSPKLVYVLSLPFFGGELGSPLRFLRITALLFKGRLSLLLSLTSLQTLQSFTCPLALRIEVSLKLGFPTLPRRLRVAGLGILAGRSVFLLVSV
jgi:hypothetical protein